MKLNLPSSLEPLRAMVMARLNTGEGRGIRDVSITMVPTAFRYSISLITSVLIARGLGRSGLGQFELIMSMASLAAGFTDLGIGQTAIRFAARASAQKNRVLQMAFFRWAFRLRIALILAVTAVFFALAPIIGGYLWHQPEITPLLRFALLGGIFSALAAVPTLYFQSEKQFGRNATVSVGSLMISFAGIMTLAFFQRWSVGLVLAVSLTASAVSSMVFLLMVPKDALWPPGGFSRIKKARIKDFWTSPTIDQHEVENVDHTTPGGYAFFMIIASLVVMMTLQADVWLMGVYLDNSQIGLYSIAKRVYMPMTVLMGAISTTLWPRASAAVTRDQVVQLMKRTMKMSAALALACLVYAIFFPMLIPMLFGEQYQGSILLAQLLTGRACLTIFLFPISILAYNFGLVRYFWILNIVQLVIVVTINVLLLPRIGPIASVLALAANTVLGNIVIIILVWRSLARQKTLEPGNQPDPDPGPV